MKCHSAWRGDTVRLELALNLRGAIVGPRFGGDWRPQWHRPAGSGGAARGHQKPFQLYDLVSSVLYWFPMKNNRIIKWEFLKRKQY
jgi:hypothetical protein